MDDWWQDFNASYTSFSSVAFRLRYDSLILFFCRLPVSGIHFQSVAFKLYSYATRIDSFEATKNVYDMTSIYIFKIFNTKLFRSLSLWMNVTCFPWGANNFGMCNAAKLYLPSNLVKLNAWFEFVVRIANAWEICCGWYVYVYMMNLLTVCWSQGSSVFWASDSFTVRTVQFITLWVYTNCLHFT